MRKTIEPLLSDLADAALRQAAVKVIERAELAGTPVLVWEKGAMRRMDPKVYRKRLQELFRKHRS